MVVGVPDAGTVIRSIPSQVLLPTLPRYSSEVPGRNASRYGLRKPVPTTRCVFASGLDASGLPGDAAPVAGSTRTSAPLRPVGSPVVRTSWARSAPPSALATSTTGVAPGGDVTVTGSPHGFTGV